MCATKVSYFFDNEVGGYCFGKGHPMKPHRVVMTQSLILHYGLHHLMDVSTKCTQFSKYYFHPEKWTPLAFGICEANPAL